MIIDIKTGGAERWHELQTAAYAGMDLFDVDFDEGAHRYSVDGVVLPSVTQVITRFVPQHGDQAAMQRGTAVHIACHLLIKGILDWGTVDPRMMGWLTSFAEWLQRTGFEVEQSEQRGANPLHGYAGTLDLRGIIPGALPSLMRGALYLQENGSIARFKAHNGRDDFKVFVGMLNFFKWEQGG